MWLRLYSYAVLMCLMRCYMNAACCLTCVYVMYDIVNVFYLNFTLLILVVVFHACVCDLFGSV